MITTITLKHEWDMGHRLPLHNGKCARLHGHRYVAEIDVTGELQTEGSATGMVVDFYVIKDRVKRFIDEEWDHRTMLWEQDTILKAYLGTRATEIGAFFVPFMPTAENIAWEILHHLRNKGSGLNVSRVRVYETPNGWAEVES